MAMRITGEGILKALRLFFGSFMVIVYLGMAVLFAVNFFHFDNTPLWTMARWIFALILGAYGIYRGYRHIKGVDYYRAGRKS